MSNHNDCIYDLPPQPPPLRMHRQMYGVVGGQCITGCGGTFPDERECRTCDACAERHCACRPGVQTLPRSKRRRGVSDYESAENKRIRGG